jgi:hypothetical protein
VNNTEKLFVHYFTKKCDMLEHVPDPNKLLKPRILTFTQP